MFEENYPPEQQAKIDRQQSLYSAQTILQGTYPSADQLVAEAKIILAYITGE